MTNFEKWQSYMSGFVSPQNYIDFGFYYLISASLQRRVWIGPDHSPLFPNIYVILVGEPGVGKGLVIKQVAEILRYHKMDDPSQLNSKHLNTVDREKLEEAAKADYQLGQEQESSVEEGKEKKFRSYEKPLRIPIAADATTFEALVRAMSKAIRRINFEKWDDKQQRNVLGLYTHSSLCFCLEEISSLFRKRTEDLVHFLIQAYDCGDYTYDTKTQGRDRIKKCCLNFFGGTTPGFMQTTFDDQLLTEGFSSRTFFIFATQNRKASLFVPELTPEQRQHHHDLIEHVGKLTKVYGKVEIEPSAIPFLEEWWKSAQNSRPNTNIKLNPYYARKNIHLIKMAMALHFGESTEMMIPKSTFERALELLGKEEKKMHYALGLDSNNPLATPARKVLKFIESQGRKKKSEILMEMWDSLPKGTQDLEEILSYLESMGKIRKIDIEEGSGVKFYYDVLRKDEAV